MVTNLQIGAFINPPAPSPPRKSWWSNCSSTPKTGEAGEWINSEGRFRFQNLTYGNEHYGPLDIHIAAEHLDAEGLLAIKDKLAHLSAP